MPTTEISLLPEAEPEVDAIDDQAGELKRFGKQALKYHKAGMNQGFLSTGNFILAGYALTQIKKLRPRKYLQTIEELRGEEFGFGARTAQRHMKQFARFEGWLQQQGLPLQSSMELEKLVRSPLLQDFVIAEKQSRLDDKQRASSHKGIAAAATTEPPSAPNDFRMPEAVMDAVRNVLGRIVTDPCALSQPWAPDLAEINFTPSEDGLADTSEWQETAWVCPGFSSNPIDWYAKTSTEMERGHIHAALLCLPESVSLLPLELFHHPIAITPQPLTVSTQRNREVLESQLPCRSLFIYMTADEPDLGTFAAAFHALAAVFSPVVCR